MLWSSIPKQRSHIKINQQVKKSLYNWIIQHPQVMVSPIANDFFKLFIDGKVEPQLVPKLLLKFLAKELHNSMVIPPEKGVHKKARDADNNIIISDSTLQK